MTVFYVAVAPLVPALHSVWFLIHIVAAAISGAAFNVGGVMSILYLVKKRAEERNNVHGYLERLPSSRKIDLIAYRFLAFAFPLWTFTVAAGAIWAEYAWGRYWGWDPKETWALVTWVIYAGYLHARSTAGWRGTRAAVIAIVGLASFWFNFVGNQSVRLRPALLRRYLAQIQPQIRSARPTAATPGARLTTRAGKRTPKAYLTGPLSRLCCETHHPRPFQSSSRQAAYPPITSVARWMPMSCSAAAARLDV